MVDQTVVAEVPLIDPNQDTDTKTISNEGVQGLAEMLAGQESINLAVESSPYTIAYNAAAGATKTGIQKMSFVFTGATGAPFIVNLPNLEHLFLVHNLTDDTVELDFGTPTIKLWPNQYALIYYDKTDIRTLIPPTPLIPYPTVETVSARTATREDIGKLLRLSDGTSVTFTIDNIATSEWEIGDYIELKQEGAGAITVTAGTGSPTLESRGSLVATNGQDAVIRVTHIDTDVWLITGDRA